MEGEERGLCERSDILGHRKHPHRASSNKDIIWMFYLCEVLLFSNVEENETFCD